MRSLDTDNVIREDGEFYIDNQATGHAYVDVHGTFGGGTLVMSILKLVADGGRLVPSFEALAADVNEPKRAFLPKGRIYCKLTGATTPVIQVDLRQEKMN